MIQTHEWSGTYSADTAWKDEFKRPYGPPTFGPCEYTSPNGAVCGKPRHEHEHAGQGRPE